MAEKYLDKAGVQQLWNKVKEQIANSSGGSGSIPTVDLNFEGGTLTSEQLAIVKNNKIVNFRIAQGGNTSIYCVCIKQEINTGSTSVYAFTSTNTPLSNVFTIAIIEASKTYQLSRSEIIYDVGFNDAQNKINLLGDGNSAIGNGISLDTLKEKLGITGGSGSSEIPTVELSVASSDDMSGILTEEQFTILQNNKVVNFSLLGIQVTANKFIPDSSAIGFTFNIGAIVYALLINSSTKGFLISETEIPFGMKIQNDAMGMYDSAGDLIGGTITKSQLQEFVGANGRGGSSNSPKLYEFNIKVKCNIATSTRYTSAILVIRGFESDYSKVQSITSDKTALFSYLIEKYRNSSMVVNGYLYSGNYPTNVTTADPILEVNIESNFIELRSFNGTQVQTTTLVDFESIFDAKFIKILG